MQRPAKSILHQEKCQCQVLEWGMLDLVEGRKTWSAVSNGRLVVWLVSAVHLCLVEDLVLVKSLQDLTSVKAVVHLDHHSSLLVLCMLKLSKATAQGL